MTDRASTKTALPQHDVGAAPSADAAPAAAVNLAAGAVATMADQPAGAAVATPSTDAAADPGAAAAAGASESAAGSTAAALDPNSAELISAASAGDLDSVQQHLKAGADAAAMDDASGTSALMAAAAGGHTAIIEALLQAGAAWNALNRSGQCAGDLAVKGGHQEAAEALLEAGVRAELVLGAAQRHSSATAGPSDNAFLRQRLSYDGTKLLDEQNLGVMMAWEGPLMQAHAQAIAANGGDILNVGFGMGLVDGFIQEHSPRSHTIIEAHPEVHQRMLDEGWGEKPGVRILFGRWQDALPQLGTYDGIFFDTFSEYYEDLRNFHQQLPKLLKPDGLYSFFNGLAADNGFFHSVCCRVVQAELARQGLQTQFIPLPINVTDAETWAGVALQYWQLDTYLLPVAFWADSEGQGGENSETAKAAKVAAEEAEAEGTAAAAGNGTSAAAAADEAAAGGSNDPAAGS